MPQQQEFTDAIALLKNDHRVVEDLFKKFKSASEGKKQAIAEKICDELTIHTMLEEEIFYPAFEGKIDEDEIAEAYVEHDSAKILVKDISAGGPDDDYYEAKVKVLSEEILHHIKEEEERGSGIFAEARKTDVDLVAMRDEMVSRKEELVKQAEAGTLEPAEPRVIDTAA